MCLIVILGTKILTELKLSICTLEYLCNGRFQDLGPDSFCPLHGCCSAVGYSFFYLNPLYVSLRGGVPFVLH